MKLIQGRHGASAPPCGHQLVQEDGVARRAVRRRSAEVTGTGLGNF